MVVGDDDDEDPFAREGAQGAVAEAANGSMQEMLVGCIALHAC